MKTFRQYLEEQLWSAIKLPDGTIKRGKFPHSSHEEIRDKHDLEITKDHKMGFLMVKDGKKTFMDRSEAAKHIGRQTDRADSTHLKPRDEINRDDDDPFAGSYASPDQIKSNVLAMRKFGTTLEEGNPLAKVAKALENKGKRGKTSYMATISADRGGMNKSEKREAHGRLQSAIRRHIEKGMLKMIGGPKQSGEYRYADPEPGEEGVAKEKSYVLAPGKHPKARDNFHRIMKKLGRDAEQESVLKVTKVGKNRPAGSLLYTTGPKTGTSEKAGRMYMNVDMPKSAGRTKFKNKDASIVVKKDDKKDDDK
jgi:hypothetical protein